VLTRCKEKLTPLGGAELFRLALIFYGERRYKKSETKTRPVNINGRAMAGDAERCPAMSSDERPNDFAELIM